MRSSQILLVLDYKIKLAFIKLGEIMTNMELVKAMRSNLFADRGTDVEAAFEDAFAVINQSKEAAALSTALMVIVNTIANVIEANEKETV